MSFDTIFDYTPVKSYLNSRIIELQSEKSNYIAEINNLTNLPAEFDMLKQEMIDYNNKNLDYIDTPINRLGNVLNEIITVETLPNESKNVLYNFYITHGECVTEDFNYKVHWMKQMIYNANALVSCINTLNQGNIGEDQINCVGNLILTKFNPHPWTSCFHGALLQIQNE